MKKESNALYILRLAVTLLAICAAVALALAGVNAITKDRIAAIQAEKTQKAIAEVLFGATDVEEISFTDESGLISTVYKSDLGYAVEVTPTSGFAGAIKMMVGVSHDGKVLGVSIISHAETAGLGAVAAENTSKGHAFRHQFQLLTGNISIGSGENQVDALTGATITSQAICDGVNAALACIENMG